MVTFEIKKEQIASKYEYADDNVKMSGTFYRDSKTNVVEKYDGSVGTADESDFIGTVNVELKEGKMIYSIPPTTSEYNTFIWAALKNIEKEIEKNTNTDGE